jgi:hypothetical protein
MKKYTRVNCKYFKDFEKCSHKVMQANFLWLIPFSKSCIIKDNNSYCVLQEKFPKPKK